jgi:hypothetical protein
MMLVNVPTQDVILMISTPWEISLGKWATGQLLPVAIAFGPD